MKNKLKIENINYSKILNFFIISIIFILINSNNLVKANSTKPIFELIPIYSNSFNDLPNTIDVELHNDKGLPVQNVQAHLDIAQENYEFYTEVDSHTNAGEEINYELRNFPNIEGLIYNKLNNKNYYSSPILTASKIIKQGGKELENDFRVRVIKNDNLEELNNNIGEEVLNITTKVDTEIEELKNIIAFDENKNPLNYKKIIEPIGQLPEGFFINEEEFLVKYIPQKGELEFKFIFNTGWKSKKISEPKIFLKNTDGTETRIINKNNIIGNMIEGLTDEELENNPNAYEIDTEIIYESEKVVKFNLKGVPIKNINGDDIEYRFEVEDEIKVGTDLENTRYLKLKEIKKVEDYKYNIEYDYIINIHSDGAEGFKKEKPFYESTKIEYKHIIKYEGKIIGERKTLLDTSWKEPDGTVFLRGMFNYDDILYPIDGTVYDDRYIEIEKVSMTPNISIRGNVLYYTPPKTNLVINKIWKGGESLKPESIDVVIKRRKPEYDLTTISPLNENIPFEEVRRVKLYKDNNWSIVVTDLDQTDDLAVPYEYIVEEINSPDNFTTTYDGLNITNTYTSPKQTVTKNVTVIGGGDNKPTVKVVLKKNGVIVENTEQIVDLNNGLSVSNLNQPTTDNEGRPVVYTIEVTEVVTNPNQENGTYIINNDILTFVPNKITVNGSVQIIGARVLWQDVEVALFKNNQEVSNTRKTITVNELETASNNTKQISYDNLDKVTVNNESINYEIRALTNIDKFNKSTNNNNNSFNTVYTYSNETKDIPYIINVVGGGNVPDLIVKLKDKTTGTLISQKNQTGETSGTFTNVPTRDTTTGNDISHDVEVIAPTNYIVTKEPNGTFTVKYVSPKTTFNAIVEFVNGKAPRPNVELQLLKDGQVVENSNKIVTNGQTTTNWTNIDLTNENAVNHVYSINVVGNVENYTKEYVGNNKVILKYVSPTINKEFNIIKEGGKTVPITIKLVKNGELLNDTVKTVNSGNKVLFENQDATDSNGNTNNYTVVVTNLPEGYTVIIGNDNTVTIKYTSPKVDVEINKIWVNGEELIPNTIEAKIQRRVKGSTNEFVDVQTFEITKDENWKKIINNLDKTDNDANLYEYKVVEVTEIANFTGTVNNFEITNTYLSPKGSKEITVNFVGKKIEVEVKLVENNNDVNTPTIKTTGGTISFNDVDLTNTNGTEKKYTADIVTNLGDRYLKVIDNNGNITLTYVPEKINVTKNVIIADSLKNKVNEVEVELYKDEKPTGITKVISISEFISNNDNTSIKQLTFENQNKEDIDGNIYSYSLKLVSNIPTYISKNINDGDLKISKVIEQKEIFANINFDGGKLRPNVEVELLKDGKVIATLKANKDGKLIFGNYDTTDENGVEYNYTFNVKNEKDLNKNGYNTNVTNNSITLSYQIPKTNINFKAILQGNGDQAVPNVHIQLIRNDNPIGEVVELNGKLEHIFNNLDLTDKDGNKYKYKVVVVGNLPEFNIIPVNDTTTILRRISHTKSEVPFLPYAGAENNIAFSIMLIIGIYVGSKTFVRIRKSFGVKNINKRGLRRK